MKTNTLDTMAAATAETLAAFGNKAENAGYILGAAKALRTEIEQRIEDGDIFEGETTYREELISRINDLIGVLSIYIATEIEK